ncbi:hypothetical protein Bbelb_396550 [Branchiostoma belcheri]|nr:hypothetical protein Bbelb_396550 [Branchiostoma belcheri]
MPYDEEGTRADEEVFSVQTWKVFAQTWKVFVQTWTEVLVQTWKVFVQTWKVLAQMWKVLAQTWKVLAQTHMPVLTGHRVDTETAIAWSCEGDTLQLSCSHGKTLLIVNANYGRTSTSHPCRCYNCRTNCRADTSLAVVRGYCQGNQQCTVAAINGVFGDPCHYVRKYLEVSYRCITVVNMPTMGKDVSAMPEGYCQEGNGASYRGTVSVTETGKTCQRWDSQTPHEHDYTPADYPSAGLEENYCRNPDDDTRVWCYTTDPDTRWDYCDVPVCATVTTRRTCFCVLSTCKNVGNRTASVRAYERATYGLRESNFTILTCNCCTDSARSTCVPRTVLASSVLTPHFPVDLLNDHAEHTCTIPVYKYNLTGDCQLVSKMPRKAQKKTTRQDPKKRAAEDTRAASDDEVNRRCTHLQRASTACTRQRGNRTEIVRCKHVQLTYHLRNVRCTQPLTARRVVQTTKTRRGLRGWAPGLTRKNDVMLSSFLSHSVPYEIPLITSLCGNLQIIDLELEHCLPQPQRLTVTSALYSAYLRPLACGLAAYRFPRPSELLARGLPPHYEPYDLLDTGPRPLHRLTVPPAHFPLSLLYFLFNWHAASRHPPHSLLCYRHAASNRLTAFCAPGTRSLASRRTAF